MPVQPSPRRRMEPPQLSTFASPGDNNNNTEDDSDRDEDGDGGTDKSSGGSEEVRDSLANGDPLGTLSRRDRNRNMGDHNRNLLNRKMTSASYDTFSSAGFGRRPDEEDSHPPEVIPLTRTGGDYKTTSCLTLSRREVYL